MGTSIVDSQNLDIDMVVAPVYLLVFDPHVGEVDLVVKVREVVLTRPFLDLMWFPIRPSIGIVPVRVTLVEPLLVLALELVVENHAVDAGRARIELLRFAQISLADLRVMFDLARLNQAGIELLEVLVMPVDAMRVEQVSAAVREDDDMAPVTIQSLGPNEALFAQVAQVARARIGGSAVVVSKVARRYHTEGTNGRERAGCRASERIRSLARVVDNLAFPSARQVEIAHEHVARIETARIVIALGPPDVLRVAATIA
jgi:hypothetical protein